MRILEGLLGLCLAAKGLQRYVAFLRPLEVILSDFFLFPYDIDVMIKVDGNTDVLALRDQLSKLDPHFVSAGIKLYFSQVRKLLETSS